MMNEKEKIIRILLMAQKRIENFPMSYEKIMAINKINSAIEWFNQTKEKL